VKITPAPLDGILVIEPTVFRDARGFFMETYHQKKYAEAGLQAVFVQDNHSRSAQRTLRGLHAQLTRPQGKLVRVIHGEIFDVAVDIRRGSVTFGKWWGTTLSAENFTQCFIPAGFAHGFWVISEMAEVEYKNTDFYAPEDQVTLAWNDPTVGVRWPGADPVLSEKDRAGLSLVELERRLPSSALRL
jgi:dTDP-4-dehydrorhamnose 3,5-epimerase